MKIEIVGRPQFRFTLSEHQLGVLTRLSHDHYDSKCRSISEPGVANFLYAWRVARDANPSVELSASFADLDLCSKLLEEFNLVGLPEDRQLIARGLSESFHLALTSASNAAKDWVVEVGAAPAISRSDALELAIVQADKELTESEGLGITSFMEASASKDLLGQVIESSTEFAAPGAAPGPRAPSA